MHARKTYEINNREQGKAAQRDQSYRSCLVALLIFFFMCLILILACVPWKTRSQREYKDRYIENDAQYHHRGRTEEISTTRSTVPSTTRTVPTTARTILKKTTTSATTAKSTPMEDVDIITRDYPRQNVKGSRHFERYSAGRTTEREAVASTVATEEILQYMETTEVKIDLTTLQDDIAIDDVTDTTWTSPSGPIVSTVTLKYNVTTVELQERVTTAKSVEEVTNGSSNRSEKSEFDIASDNVTSTLSARWNDAEGSAAENTTDKFERLRAGGVVTENIIASTTPSLSTNAEENIEHPSDKYDHSERSQFDGTTSNVSISTSPTQSDLEASGETKSFTAKYLNYESFTTAEYNATFTDENVTEGISSAKMNYTPSAYEKPATNAKVKNETEEINASTRSRNEITEKYSENVISGTTEKYDASSTSNYANASTILIFDEHNVATSTIVSTSPDGTNPAIATTTNVPRDEDVCETGRCRQIASRMLSHMNHTADPCDDFYEYACGGFEADSQLMDGNLVRTSRNYERIANQMLKEKRENVHSTFATYYDSCVQYERSMNFTERIRMANDAFQKIGGFYTNATWSDNYEDFTDLLFARLILHHSALLFDVVPELDEYHPNSFTLKIGPTTYRSPFEAEHVEDPCSEFETSGHYVDLEVLYDDYKKCKNDTRQFTRSVKEALTVLNVFKDVDGNNLESHVESNYIEETVNVIDSVIIRGYFSHFPSESEIREAYLMNNYSKISLDELQSGSAFVNWTRLIRSLTGMNVITSEDIQVHFHTALIQGLRKLEEFGKENPMGLNNAIMGLYAHKLYQELVLPRYNNVKNYCLRVATYLLRLEASSLYISSFTDHEITQMNRMMEKIFDELKETLKLKIEEAQWAKEEGRQGLLRKIKNLKLALPIVSYFKNRDSLYSEYNVPQIVLSNNYFNNSMILLKRYRTLIYAELKRQVGDPKQIWTYYAAPFQSQARTIYGLDLIVIPYGIIDWSLIKNEVDSSNYLLLATLGNLIAHQIAHHFDANGIHYWNQSRNIQDSLMYENEFTDTNFDDSINCQKEILYQGPINMTLAFIDQTVSFRIPRLTLNERLSEIMGLRLAYDTLARMRSGAEKRLPWMGLRIDQLFYLAYAQMYCTKTPLASSYVSLHESEDLPSRVRVFVSASNNKHLADAWKCPAGSQIAPNDICSVFPYIDFKETAPIPE